MRHLNPKLYTLIPRTWSRGTGTIETACALVVVRHLSHRASPVAAAPARGPISRGPWSQGPALNPDWLCGGWELPALARRAGREARSADGARRLMLPRLCCCPDESMSPLPEQDKAQVKENLLEGIIRCGPRHAVGRPRDFRF